jgi:O6-methylguanine-DNA--protein-cysteine methyltransferase
MDPRSTSCFTIMPSPIDELLLVAEGDALTGLTMLGAPGASGPPVGSRRDDDHPVLVETRRQLEQYFAGERSDFDLELAPSGTPFQLRVWQALREIPYGRTISYGELASAHRQRQELAGRRVGERAEPDRRHRSLPSGDRRQRQARRLRRGTRPQAAAAPPRAGRRQPAGVSSSRS